MVEWLVKETCVQRRVIEQLKKLQTSTSHSNPTKFNPCEDICDKGHMNCRINHAKFSLVRNPKEPSEPTPNATKKITVEKMDVLELKKLSRKVDLLQAKYGMPCGLNYKTMVASADTIYAEEISSLFPQQECLSKKKENFPGNAVLC